MKKIDKNAYQTAMDYALKIHKLLKCNTLSRSDFRYNAQDGVVFLEINTHPGMTPLSLVPEQAKYVGIDYGKLCTSPKNTEYERIYLIAKEIKNIIINIIKR